MSERIDAIFENGVFLPQVPVSIPDGSQVTLEVATKTSESSDDLDDVKDLLDVEFMDSCRQSELPAPTLEEVRNILGRFSGSLSERILEEREDR